MLPLVGRFPIHFGDPYAKIGVVLTTTYDVVNDPVVQVVKHTGGGVIW